jgi:hypothetical protein
MTYSSLEAPKNMFTSLQELEQGIDHIGKSPHEVGVVELIVCRPEIGERLELEYCELDTQLGLIGDSWLKRGNRRREKNTAHPDMQLNIMNSRVISLISQDKARWSLAGDQFFVDLNLSKENLPAGTQLKIGTAKIEVTSEPHLGCKKFQERYGKDSVVFVNSERGKAQNFRGINAKVIESGKVRLGDSIVKISP